MVSFVDTVLVSFDSASTLDNRRSRFCSSEVNTLSAKLPSGASLPTAILNPRLSVPPTLEANPLASFPIPSLVFSTGSSSVFIPTERPRRFKNVSFSPVKVYPDAFTTSSRDFSSISLPSFCSNGLSEFCRSFVIPTILPIAFSNSFMFLVCNLVISSIIVLINSF